jgi:hypothetical protein
MRFLPTDPSSASQNCGCEDMTSLQLVVIVSTLPALAISKKFAGVRVRARQRREARRTGTLGRCGGKEKTS